MASFDDSPPEVRFGDPPVAKGSGRGRWTVGRIATDLAMIMVAVPFGLDSLAPSPRGGCGMTPEFYASSVGLAILGLRASWIALRFLINPEMETPGPP